MPRTETAAALLIGVLLVAGCSGSKPDYVKGETNLNAVGIDSEPAGNSPLAGMSALQIWEKTKADADQFRSVRVAARFLDGEQIDLRMTDTGKVSGRLKIRGDQVQVRRLGKTLYLKAGLRFWTRNTDAQTARTLNGKWVTVRKGSSSDLEQFFQLTDMDFIVSDIMSLSAEEQKTLKLVPGIDIGSAKTVGLAEADNGEGDAQTLYLAAADPAVPLNLNFGTDSEQFMKFRDWGENFSVAPPPDAISLTSAR
jgi:hypothetical protein